MLTKPFMSPIFRNRQIINLYSRITIFRIKYIGIYFHTVAFQNLIVKRIKYQRSLAESKYCQRTLFRLNNP